MDFEIAAQRLAKDQKSALARSRASRNARTASTKARREAQATKAKAEARLRQKKLEILNNAKIVERVVRLVRLVERRLGVANVVVNNGPVSTNSGGVAPSSSASATDDTRQLFTNNHPIIHAQGWKLQATSIHGEGDKIALPPSILEALTSQNNSTLDPWGSNGGGRPLAFRIGVLDPDYTGFPASEKMKAFVESVRQDVLVSSSQQQTMVASSSAMQSVIPLNDNDNDEIIMSDDSDNDEDEEDHAIIIEAYLDELSHRYISYTHGTVVEFTQEDGCVGLPEPIARVLLLQLQQRDNERHDNNNHHQHRIIPIKRTVDPASTSMSTDVGDDTNKGDGDAMDIVPTNDSPEQPQTEKTPGHLAYGAFDIPDLPIEITPINSLPAGTDCTFTPTTSSITNGFYKLTNVKAVLEQSLMRTRATLSKGDVIRTWRRGVSFDLIVSSVVPSEFGVVSCVNTDLNVDIGPPEEEDEEEDLNKKPARDDDVDEVKKGSSGQSLMGGQGRLLSEDTSQKQQHTVTAAVVAETKPIPKVELAPEPAADKIEGVCNIQIRGRSISGDNNITGRRRFDVEVATMNDLFQYASYVCGGVDPKTLRLVTRFPRRVFTLLSSSEEEMKGQQSNNNDATTLKEAGLNQGQELFMIEYL
eukprot:CAMPEP_0201740460 /NCGR_PEP_ID=MMETSP0593-20130828/46312_1 /ASSEMBLY_ACC=CAM_ASM_000672 /TAXON_ID=267983 /ORGANISM="Skeletonema japonicum, Strain CCMP2506" /LENGTH=643 /DNA_ID=CAMNT_0048234771 /DNA_START=29 /DNA_END=1960 /DNA_ORIENTATION=+